MPEAVQQDVYDYSFSASGGMEDNTQEIFLQTQSKAVHSLQHLNHKPGGKGGNGFIKKKKKNDTDQFTYHYMQEPKHH